MSKAVWMATAAALLLAVASHVEAQSVKREPIKPLNSVNGSSSYRVYCAQCHGISGRGDGPVSKVLKVPPADLTRISTRHGGQFPAAEVKRIIMGEDVVTAHGGREMPLWGPVFRSVEDPGVAELRVANLVIYLERLQEKK